jgi:quinoprotein glucose dehydrogenase
MTVGLVAQSAHPPSTATGEWTVYGGDIGHTRCAPLDQIAAANLDDLEVAWRFKTDNLSQTRTATEMRLVKGTPK